MLKSIFIARYLIIGLRIPKKYAHFATYLRSKFLYSSCSYQCSYYSTPSEGFGIPSGNVRGYSTDFHGHERGGLKTGRKKSVEIGFLFFKSLIMKDSDYSKICAQTAKSANLIVFI